MTINYIKIVGENNLVIQQANGDIVEITISAFIEQRTTELSDKIRLLEKTIVDKEKIQFFNDKEIIKLSADLSVIRMEKSHLEKRISDMLIEFDNKDFSKASHLFQVSFSLFMSGKIAESLEILNKTNLETELDALEYEEKRLLIKKQELAETFAFKAFVLSLIFEYQEAKQNIINAIKLDPNQSSYWNKLGVIYNNIGEFENAFEALQKSLKLEMLFNEPKSESVGIKYERLAEVSISLGKVQQAKEYLEQSLAIGLYLNNNEILIETYFGLGKLAKMHFSYKQNLNYLELALQVIQKAEYKEVYLADLYESMGTAHFQLNNFSEALRYFEMSLSIEKESKAEDVLIGGSIYFNLGCAKTHLNDFEEGIRLIKYGIELDEKIFGKDHYGIARYYSFLGSLSAYKPFGFDSRKAYLLKAIELDEKYYGINSHVTANNYYGYAITLQTENFHSEAVLYFNKGIQARRSVIRVNDMTIGKWLMSLGLSNACIGERMTAIKNIELSINVIRENLNNSDEVLNGTLFLSAATDLLARLQ